MKTIFFIFLMSNITFASETNRFQIVTNSSGLYLLDSSTGRIWEKKCYQTTTGQEHKCEREAWLEMGVLGLNSDLKKTHERIDKFYNELGQLPNWKDKFKNYK